MITAKEAKQIVDESGVEADAIINNTIDKLVRDAAAKGQRNVFLNLGAAETFSISRVTPTAIQTQIMDKLGALGYRVQFVRGQGAPYVPPGRMDDFGEGPKYQNYGIAIHW